MTAAPGPQQPDEELCRCWHGTMTGRCFEHGVQARSTDPGGDGYSCACPRPAAPSAQPANPADVPCPQCGERLPLDRVCLCCTYTPAQPVRDTKEKRR